MSKVTLVIATATTPLPAGATFAQYKYTIFASDGTTVVQSMDSTATFVTFANDVPAGAYVASAVALDASGANLGVTASANFTVVAVSTFEQPSTVTVTLS